MMRTQYIVAPQMLMAQKPNTDLVQAIIIFRLLLFVNVLRAVFFSLLPFCFNLNFFFIFALVAPNQSFFFLIQEQICTVAMESKKKKQRNSSKQKKNNEKVILFYNIVFVSFVCVVLFISAQSVQKNKMNWILLFCRYFFQLYDKHAIVNTHANS